ncbi:MAG: 2OG-Fe(II) oxygenase [Bdellovibrionales bacterium]|nr:2OG-Fe(II) oxygenase [Bdellovibrionales bacterium]
MQNSSKTNNSVKVIDSFFSQASDMRDHYDRTFANPLQATEQRFQWDYWYVPEQYCLHRAPAHLFFPEDLYTEFESALSEWGQERLGCSEISTPWISYYVHGGEQRLHADNPHGPWAYVFSLSNWQEGKFEGGLTQILSEGVLNYWNTAEFQEGLETPQIFESIEPEFNRLCVFDPRRPHGVSRVHGSPDPRHARVVLHGWFLQPQPTVRGGLENDDLSESLGEVLNPALDEVDQKGSYHGYCLFKVGIQPNGSVADISLTVSTLRSISNESAAVQVVQDTLSSALSSCRFRESDQASELTLPLVFE